MLCEEKYNEMKCLNDEKEQVNGVLQPILFIFRPIVQIINEAQTRPI